MFYTIGKKWKNESMSNYFTKVSCCLNHEMFLGNTQKLFFCWTISIISKFNTNENSQWRIQPSVLECRFMKGPKPGYPKTKNSTDLGHYFWETQVHLKKREMSDWPPANGSPKPSKMWQKLIFLCRRNVCAFEAWQLVLIWQFWT